MTDKRLRPALVAARGTFVEEMGRRTLRGEDGDRAFEAAFAMAMARFVVEADRAALDDFIAGLRAALPRGRTP